MCPTLNQSFTRKQPNGSNRSNGLPGPSKEPQKWQKHPLSTRQNLRSHPSNTTFTLIPKPPNPNPKALAPKTHPFNFAKSYFRPLSSKTQSVMHLTPSALRKLLPHGMQLSEPMRSIVTFQMVSGGGGGGSGRTCDLPRDVYSCLGHMARICNRSSVGEIEVSF